jgi:arylsulfatase
MPLRDERGREQLPIPDRPYEGVLPYDARDPRAKFAPIEPLRPPLGAPNVLIVLLDDVGFGASSAFGGPVAMGTAERLAADGLRYTRFHTAALGSPTRAALLSGRNHHSVGMGGTTEMATSAPGYTSVRPNSCAPLPETLRLNGYATAQFGKCHGVPSWESSPFGPFDRWPTGSGFEYFYGFIGRNASQWWPLLYENTLPLAPPDDPDYHLSDDLAERVTRWIRQQKALAADRPFFVYLAPGAAHAPHHVAREWIDRYDGRFGAGWDALRAETIARQRELGVIPANAELTARHDEIPGWEQVAQELKPVLRRQMEVYAGFLQHADHCVGRVIDTLEELNLADDTLTYYILGDNGASAEGQRNGTFSEVMVANGAASLETPEYLAARLDDWGGPRAFNHYAVGWAHAMNTPYKWTKQIASHWGGSRTGMIVHWPNGIAAGGELRHQFHHVIDVAPTVLEVAGLPEPMSVHGVQQRPIEGVSMAYSFDDATAPDRRETQYFEIFGNRAIYHRGWTAVAKHRTPWIEAADTGTFDDDEWELYDTTTDWTQTRDLAREQPERLSELKRLWLIEAVKHNVLPLDDRLAERLDAVAAGRPRPARGTSQLLFQSMRLSENSVIDVKNRSHSVTAEVVVPEPWAEGVIVAQGAYFGGWSLYTKRGRPRYHYNFCDLRRFTVEGTAAVPPGTHQVRMEFAYDGGGVGKGGIATLYIDGKPVGTGRVEATMPFMLSLGETLDVGGDLGSPVSDDYPARGNEFTGEINWVQIDVERCSADAGERIDSGRRGSIALTRR